MDSLSETIVLEPSSQALSDSDFGGVTVEGDRALAAQILEAAKGVQDPEIPVNLVDLGLIYEIKISDVGVVQIKMTLTSPSCPVAGALPAQVQSLVSLVPGVAVVMVELVFEPVWTQDRMTTEAKLELGLL